MKQSLESMIPLCCALAVMAGVAPGVSGQGSHGFTASTPWQVNPEYEEWFECAIGVSQTNHLEALVTATRESKGIGTAAIFVMTGGPVVRHGDSFGAPDFWVSREADTDRPSVTSPEHSVVLDSGRVVAALTDQRGRLNFNRPHISYSDDFGATWHAEGGIAPLVIDPLLIIEATTIDADDSSGCGGMQDGDTPEHVDRRQGAPSIAADRAPEPDHVYIAFYARSVPGASNADIFIARSIDGGTTWNSNDIVQVTDEMLGLTGQDTHPMDGADQYVPAIAIDSCGGVNLMFYDNRADADRSDKYSMVDVYFARITNFGTRPSVETARLTPESFPADKCTAPAMTGFLGAYHTMDVSSDGRNIWAAYIARESDPALGWSGKNCYAHRIQIHCLQQSDFNGDGAVTSHDASAYLVAWAESEPAADFDLDWAVTGADLDAFMAAYDRESRGE